MTITTKDLSGPESYTGVARDEHEKKLKELQELQAKIDKLKPQDDGKKKSKQKKN